jgi:methyl-accepting chemotaxis protein
MKKRYTLERKMLSYFGLIAAASLLITVELIWAIRAATPVAATAASYPTEAAGVIRATVNALDSLRHKALLMCAVQAVVTLIVLIMFMRRITGPLQQMVEHSQVISEGDLSRTIPVRGRDELGMLGETINGLTSNIQEIVALGLSTESSLRESVQKLRGRLRADEKAQKYVDDMEAELDGFRMIVADFKLFPAPLTDEESSSAA